MKKNKFIIPIHSFVDVITNSSTELFIIEKEKGLEMVKEIVEIGLKKFPPENLRNSDLSVIIDNPDHYNEGFSYSFDGADIDDIEGIIISLKRRGYKIEAPKKYQEPEVIIIAWERGDMKKGFIEFIEQSFGVKLIQD